MKQGQEWNERLKNSKQMAGQVIGPLYLQRHYVIFSSRHGTVGIWPQTLCRHRTLVGEELLMQYLSWLILFLEMRYNSALKGQISGSFWYLAGVNRCLLFNYYPDYSLNLETSPSGKVNKSYLTRIKLCGRNGEHFGKHFYNMYAL